MGIHDWVQSALLVVITIFSIGRWAQARESTETADAKDAKQVQANLDSYCKVHDGEHQNVWRELERQRKQYHEVRIPWEQAVSDKLARLDEHEKAQDGQLGQLWTILSRRRSPRDT